MAPFMDVRHSITARKLPKISFPYMEDYKYICMTGTAGSLARAINVSTANLAGWIQQEYGLTRAELIPLLGFFVEYEIMDMAGENTCVAAKIRKEALLTFRKR